MTGGLQNPRYGAVWEIAEDLHPSRKAISYRRQNQADVFPNRRIIGSRFSRRSFLSSGLRRHGLSIASDAVTALTNLVDRIHLVLLGFLLLMKEMTSA